MENFKYSSREKIKENLVRGDYKRISDLMDNLYTAGSIREQMNGNRPLRKVVIAAANKLIIEREKQLAV